MHLSDHFTLAELTRSSTAVRQGIANKPDAEQIVALRNLAQYVLEPVRRHYCKPVIVTSGFRGAALNKAIGGSAKSQHSDGEAADFTVQGVSNLEVCKWIEANLKFDQLIYEFGEDGWVHCSYRADRARREVLSAVRASGKTKYLKGLVKEN